MAVSENRWKTMDEIRTQLADIAREEGRSFDPERYWIELTEDEVVHMTAGKAKMMDHIQTAEGRFPVKMTDRIGVFRRE